MSKRAEDMAWENYPEHHYLDNDDFDVNEDFRDCYIEGYEQAEKDMIERIRKQVKQWMPKKDGEEHTRGERLAFNSVLHLLEEMEEE